MCEPGRQEAVPARVVAPIVLIDKSNVDKALAAFPQPFEPYDNPITGGK